MAIVPKTYRSVIFMAITIVKVKRPPGRPKKAELLEVVGHWKESRKANPKYSKALLAKYFKMGQTRIRFLLHQAVDQGLLPPETFGVFKGKGDKS